jgi:solute carrier family 25 aspartate/glutamate transporter 12/13
LLSYPAQLFLTDWSPRYLDTDQFVTSIAPSGDLKIGREQWSILFRVADKNRRGLVSWDDFLVFETALKRPDADYWVAFQFFDVYVTPSTPSVTHS